MTIQLTAAQSAWIEAQVAAGRFTSAQEAVAAAMARLESEASLDDDWAKPLIAEALDGLDRGEGTEWVEGRALQAIRARHARR